MKVYLDIAAYKCVLTWLRAPTYRFFLAAWAGYMCMFKFLSTHAPLTSSFFSPHCAGPWCVSAMCHVQNVLTVCFLSLASHYSYIFLPLRGATPLHLSVNANIFSAMQWRCALILRVLTCFRAPNTGFSGCVAPFLLTISFHLHPSFLVGQLYPHFYCIYMRVLSPKCQFFLAVRLGYVHAPLPGYICACMFRL
jgi:hypothetical protein